MGREVIPMFKIIIGIIVVTIIVLIVMANVDKVTSLITGDPTTSTSTYEDSDTLQVTITGEVNHSGTYVLSLDSTLASLLSSAGGTTSNADSKAYRTNLVLANKESYYIAPLYDNSNTCAATPIDKVCVNTADKEALDALSAFSNSVAAAIVSYRTSNGDFERIEELKNVSGIGNATFEKCKNYVTLSD